MAITRRDFFKFGAAAGAAALLSGVINRSNDGHVKNKFVPGAGEKGHFQPEVIAEIDSEVFLNLCSRCGVCIAECPFSAIKSTGWQLPLLTDETLHKCPGFDICGVCLAVCPTSALSEAFKPVEEKFGLKSGVEKNPWWEGERINTDFLEKPEEVD
jgi:ferredoxin